MDPRLLLAESIARLAEVADRALARGLTRHEFFAVCIDGACGAWSAVVGLVTSDCGVEGTIVVGTVPRASVAEDLATSAPALMRGLKTRPPPGSVHALALGMRAGTPCASLYALTPVLVVVTHDLEAAPATWRSAC
jgi:hypothetical protein